VSKRRSYLALAVLLLLPFPDVAGQRRERSSARLEVFRNLSAAVQPAGPCRFSYVGRWFAEDGTMYEVEQEANQLTWLVPAFGIRARGRCEGEMVWLAMPERAVRGTAEGREGGPAIRIRWSDQRTFERIPDVSLTADRTSVSQGEPIEFIAQVFPPESSVNRYFIEFGDGHGDQSEAPPTRRRFRHVYENAGVFNVVLEAILFDRRFSSPPLRIEVFEQEVPPPARSFRLEVDRRVARVGEGLRLRGVLTPRLPGAIYSFTFAEQASPWLSSPIYEFRCDSEGVWVAQATVQLPGAAAVQSLVSEPVEVIVQPALIVLQQDYAPLDRSGWLVWLVLPVVLLGGLALTCRRVFREREQRKQASMGLRVKLERYTDFGSQSINPDPERLCRTELLLRPGVDIGKQRAEGLSIAGERQGP
jgi:hypothetical protein